MNLNSFNNQDSNLKNKLINVKDWIVEHSRLIMPIVLVVCVVITVIIALNANREDKLQKKAEELAVETTTPSDAENVLTTPEYDLEENAYPEINELVRKYYDAQAMGDVDTISSLNTYLNDIELLRIQELSQYIDSYPEINVYTKPGLTEGAFVTYVCSYVKFNDIDDLLPGMQTYYVGKDIDGNYYINDGTYDEAIYEYIKSITVQDDLVDLNNRVVVEYNNLLENSQELNDYIVYIKEKINEEVGVKLAESEAPADEVVDNTKEDEALNTSVATVVSKVRVTERVNVRKSDSKDSDKLGSASAGEEFTLIEKLENGWTKIDYNGKEAFINSDYVEDVETVNIEIVDASQNKDSNNNSNADTVTEVSNDSSEKKVTVKSTSVRVRKEANTNCDVLGSANEGDEFVFVEKSGEWTKIKYLNGYGYIKTEYLK